MARPSFAPPSLRSTRNAIARVLLVAAVPLLAHCSSSAPPSASSGSAADSQGLSGHFTSLTCEPFDATTYQIRHYEFGLGSATSTWVRYGDPTCAADSELMTIVMTGSAQVTGLSSAVLGAANITVSIADKTVTPTAAGLPFVQAACGAFSWQAGVAQDVSTGCGALLQQTDDCPAEYDLMKLTLKGLVFGDRSQPLCSEDTRPTMLSAFSVVLDPLGYVAPSTPAATTDDNAGSEDAAEPSSPDAGPPGDGDAGANPTGPTCDGLDDGTYCGSDGVGGDPDTLYECTGGVAAVAEACSAGCSANGGGTDGCD